MDGPSGKGEGVERSTRPWWSTAGRGWGTKDEARTDRLGSDAYAASHWFGTRPVEYDFVSRTRISRKFGSTVLNYEIWEPSQQSRNNGVLTTRGTVHEDSTALVDPTFGGFRAYGWSLWL